MNVTVPFIEFIIDTVFLTDNELKTMLQSALPPKNCVNSINTVLQYDMVENITRISFFHVFCNSYFN